MKRIFSRGLMLVIALFVLALNTCNVDAKDKLSYYRERAKRIEKRSGIEVVDASEMTFEKLTNRKGKVLIERVIGRVKNKKGDGLVLNSGVNGGGGYISYRSEMDRLRKGDIVVSYLLYNPETETTDGVVARWDYRLNKR